MTRPADVDAYIAGLAPELRPVAEAVRASIRKALPKAVEIISYSIPAYRMSKRTVVYFAVWKKHVGIYPISEGSEAFEARLKPYRATKATVQIPLDQPLPHALIAEIARTEAVAHLGRRPGEAPRSK